MAVDGTYDIELQTQRGNQPGKITLKADGNSLSGTYSTQRGDQAFTGGTISGDDLAWSISMSGPQGQMELAFKAKVTGDEIEGTLQMGTFGTSNFKGKRA